MNILKMKEIKLKSSYKGTRILLGNKKRTLINKMIDILISQGFTEIEIPIIQLQETFKNKVGEENNNMMFNFQDRAQRNICLAPEYTSVIQQLSKETFKHQKDVKVFYVSECFRGEKPQKGRYRQFTQLGVEVINPTNFEDYNPIPISELAMELLNTLKINYKVIYDTKRGLDFYLNGLGFEIHCDKLGASKQVCGGGFYDRGCGFSIGVDRILPLC